MVWYKLRHSMTLYINEDPSVPIPGELESFLLLQTHVLEPVARPWSCTYRTEPPANCWGVNCMALPRWLRGGGRVGSRMRGQKLLPGGACGGCFVAAEAAAR